MSDRYRLSTTGMSIIGSPDGKDAMTIEDAVVRMNEQEKRIAELEAIANDLVNELVCEGYEQLSVVGKARNALNIGEN